MKALRLHGSGAESLVYEEAPRPSPGAGEILVAVRAAGVTPSELQWEPTSTLADGRPRPRPVIPGHEFSGVEVGTHWNSEGVTPAARTATRISPAPRDGRGASS